MPANLEKLTFPHRCGVTEARAVRIWPPEKCTPPATYGWLAVVVVVVSLAMPVVH